MCSTREKLVELISQENECCRKTLCCECKYERDEDCGENSLADYLIAHGVIVQKEAKLYWKPLGGGTSQLTCSACDSRLGCGADARFCPECGAKFVVNEA